MTSNIKFPHEEFVCQQDPNDLLVLAEGQQGMVFFVTRMDEDGVVVEESHVVIEPTDCAKVIAVLQAYLRQKMN